MQDKLRGHIPEHLLVEIDMLALKYQIDTPLRMAHFLAQCSHESAGFTVFTENLNYSAEGLLKIFPKYFKTASQAKLYARQPAKIANRVYADRMGNSSEASGDGWRYKGRGCLQTTGFNNYKSFDTQVPEDLIQQPDLVATKYPLLSAAWFWEQNKLNTIADKGATNQVITEIRKKVNGGTNGVVDTIEKFKFYYKILSRK